MPEKPLEIYRIFAEKPCPVCGLSIKVVGMRRRTYYEHKGELFTLERFAVDECKKRLKAKVSKH